MFANVVVDTFIKGGPIMWPILVTFIVALATLTERLIWWSREGRRRDPETLEAVYEALEKNDSVRAAGLAKDSGDPRLRTIFHGLEHAHASVIGAMQVAAGHELRRAGRFLGVLDTIVTLAPLLGLLGTVTGIMDSFKFVGAEDLAPMKVSGGIAEALVATACGLGIAIFCLVPFNYFNGRVAGLQFELETTINNVELLLAGARSRDSAGAASKV